MEELASRGEELTVGHLLMILKGATRAPAPIEIGHVFLTYALATEVLRYFMGNEWTNENVFSVHESVSRRNQLGRKYLKTDDPGDARFVHMMRVESLAELLFNFQNTLGFKDRMATLRHADLESTAAEFECAALFSSPELEFAFIRPSGSKGEDFDGQIRTSFGRHISVEIKSKSEESELAIPAVLRRLEEGRKQLPKASPGIVLLRVPDHWNALPDFQEIISKSTQEVFRQSNRLVATAFTWYEWNEYGDSGKSIDLRFQLHRNIRSSHWASDIDELPSAMLRARRSDWVRFHVLVERVISRGFPPEFDAV
jgi:hypothetical protein